MTPGTIDLRSDTVTLPTEGMRKAMASAAVGDDVYGEDPTARRLEEEIAGLLGKEAALFVPTGTMANQIALALSTRPGDEVIVADDTHCETHESGAAAALSGLQFRRAGPARELTAAHVQRALRPPHVAFPESTLLVLENSHNASGGSVMDAGTQNRLVEVARGSGLRAHLDGARLWNASAALNEPLHDLAAPFDTVSVCFSKGLGAPVGSAVAGTRLAMSRARRLRKRMGGGMRQVGFLAAAALYALRHHRDRLPEDHAAARRLAEALARSENAVVEPTSVRTNIVVFRLRAGSAAALAGRAGREGVRVAATGPDTVRAVTHLDVSREQLDRAASVIATVADAMLREATG